jgi:hypothetical protein
VLGGLPKEIKCLFVCTVFVACLRFSDRSELVRRYKTCVKVKEFLGTKVLHHVTVVLRGFKMADGDLFASYPNTVPNRGTVLTFGDSGTQTGSALLFQNF